ncbi:hypothetical protein M758_9G141000 [Ceratodon purpureus]|nr:hypothetical protein M758_9G141000 [Ceratodon purpureus]
MAGSSRFIKYSRRELQRMVVIAISKSPGAHYCHPHPRCFLEHLPHCRPGRFVCGSVHQPVDVGAVHVECLPSEGELMSTCLHKLPISAGGFQTSTMHNSCLAVMMR